LPQTKAKRGIVWLKKAYATDVGVLVIYNVIAAKEQAIGHANRVLVWGGIFALLVEGQALPEQAPM
jgi:hypothetical protein